MLESISRKKINRFDIKIIALVAMFIAHIYEFFNFTGHIPALFDYIGQIAYPLFLFMIVEGFFHTSSRQRYIFRVYILGSFMAIFNMVTIFLQRADEMYVSNNVLFPYVMVLIFLCGLENLSENKGLGILMMSLPLVGEAFIWLLYTTMTSIGIIEKYSWIFMAIVRFNPFSVSFGEVGLEAIIGALILYLLRDKKDYKIAIYCVFNALFLFVRSIVMNNSYGIAHASGNLWINIVSQAIVGVLLFMYNGEKGRDDKKLFYIFYPSHIYALYFLSLIVYNYTH